MIYFLRVQQQLVLEYSYQQVMTNLKVRDSTQQLCNNKISISNIKVLYCQKHTILSNNKVSQQFLSQKNLNYFSIYTEKIKDLFVNLYVLPLDHPSFYLFGATQYILIQNSQIYVKITKILAESALICYKCDLYAIQSDLIFIGVGTKISGLILIGNNNIQLENCTVQSRLSGMTISGLVLQSNKITINLKECNITSYFDGNGNIGTFISLATNHVQILSSNVNMCTNVAINIGSGEKFVIISGGVSYNCNICGSMKYSYGICQNQLVNSEIINYKLVCKPFFIFNGELCSCQDGSLINGSSCIKIQETTSYLLNVFEGFDKSLRQFDIKLIDQISALKHSSQYNAINQFQQNISSISKINTYLDTQSGVAEINLRYLALNEAIKLFILKIQCIKQLGYAFINQQCQYVECPISGQYTINGVCQCPIYNMIIIGNACACPINSKLIDNACICIVINQIIKDGACQCAIIDAIISGSACVCPYNSDIVGNACVCTIPSQIMTAGVCTCQTSGAFIFNGVCSCGTDGLNISNVCNCPFYSSLIGNSCICISNVGLSMIDGSCKCIASDHTIINGMCQYTVENGDTGIKCFQSIYAYSFDIQAITHSVINNANYSSGYVFKTSTIITNAYIDVQNYIYSTNVQPLFQSQASFMNIKVQIGTQTVNTGSILTFATTIVIVQMNIISKLNTQLTVNSIKQLQILQNETSSTNIQNLLVNLTFMPSSGNITLINISTGIMNIACYHVLGTYQSTECVTMIALNIAESKSQIQIFNVSFQPSIYDVGRFSSYLLSTVGVCNISFNNISVILGSVKQFQILASITSTQSIQYQFGGLISNLNSNTNITITSLLLNCYQTIKTDYITNLGFILGTKNNYVDNINFTIQNMCIQQNFSSTNIDFSSTGLIASSNGDMSIKQSNIIFTLQNNNKYSGNFGAIGVVSKIRGQSFQLINLQVCMNTLYSFKLSSIGFFGHCEVETSVIQNSLFKNFNLSSRNSAGILGSGAFIANNLVNNTTVQTCNISAGLTAGGLFSDALRNYYICIQNSTVQNINISSTDSQIGAMIGRMVGTDKADMTIYFNNLSISSNNITCRITASGAVGYIVNYYNEFKLNASFVDMFISNSIISGNAQTSGLVASLSSVGDVQNLILQNVTVSSCQIKCVSGTSGGLVGTFGYNQTLSATLTVQNITLQNTYIAGLSYVAGFLAYSQKCIQFTALKIYNSTIFSIVLSGQNCAMINGFSNGTHIFDIQTSKTTGNNFVNTSSLQNCVSITSSFSQSGC
ncbi:Conserved_hypothetical protein [Hexamita inflata]|uniref:Uncharacterized protein n=1 Tax=Hexamita inflata TaxID=28002 RepID=A0AA86UKL8_9EUKA|nr:Conserved hypothetical protein [Hexamita inflata]